MVHSIHHNIPASDSNLGPEGHHYTGLSPLTYKAIPHPVRPFWVWCLACDPAAFCDITQLTASMNHPTQILGCSQSMRTEMHKSLSIPTNRLHAANSFRRMGLVQGALVLDSIVRLRFSPPHIHGPLLHYLLVCIEPFIPLRSSRICRKCLRQYLKNSGRDIGTSFVLYTSWKTSP